MNELWNNSCLNSKRLDVFFKHFGRPELARKVFGIKDMASDPAPRGGISGPCPPVCLCPPNENCASPKRGLCPEEMNRLGASVGVFCGLTPDFVTILGLRLFFLEITCFRSEKLLEFAISVGKPLAISVKTFLFLEITCFWSEKPLEFAILVGKPLAISVKTLFFKITFFRSEKLLTFPISAGKSL